MMYDIENHWCECEIESVVTCNILDNNYNVQAIYYIHTWHDGRFIGDDKYAHDLGLDATSQGVVKGKKISIERSRQQIIYLFIEGL